LLICTLRSLSRTARYTFLIVRFQTRRFIHLLLIWRTPKTAIYCVYHESQVSYSNEQTRWSVSRRIRTWQRTNYIIIVIHKTIVKSTSYFRFDWRNAVFRSADPYMQYRLRRLFSDRTIINRDSQCLLFMDLRYDDIIENILLPYHWNSLLIY